MMKCNNCDHLCLLDDGVQWACDVSGEKEATYLDDSCEKWERYMDNRKFKGHTMFGVPMYKTKQGDNMQMREYIDCPNTECSGLLKWDEENRQYRHAAEDCGAVLVPVEIVEEG